MKKISIDCKFTVDIEDKYFDENYSQRKNEVAIIRIRAEEENVLLSDLADVIISCTYNSCSLLEEPINYEKFPKLDIYLTISKSDRSSITYSFKINNCCSVDDVLLEIVQNIKI